VRKIRPWPVCVGHNAVLGCTVEDDWLIGMGSPRVAAILARFSGVIPASVVAGLLAGGLADVLPDLPQ
jgi:carbonic anhydrase/acetyltransferase-like protein (isoleucine patch superfamily)